MEQIFYVVGKITSETDKGDVWSFEGLFDSEELAFAHCSTPDHFIGPVILNEFTGGLLEDREWPNAYFPIAKD